MNTKRVAMVTGGTRGIGKAVVQKLVADGYFVAFNYRANAALAENMVQELGAENVRGYCCDVAQYAPMKAMVDDIMAREGRIDVLVSNAGITRDNSLMMMSLEDWQELININLTGSFHATKAVLMPMLRAKKGRIVYMSSVTGLSGMRGQFNYAASKAGLIGMTKSLAKEVATYGITVNAVAPGFIEGDMTAKTGEQYLAEVKTKIPQQRLGTSAEVAGLVSYLVSDIAGYITGEVIRIDGGLGM